MNAHPKQTLDQRRAAHAWERVKAVDQLDEKAQKEFGTQAKKLPTRILTAGLGQALAFLEAKRKDSKGKDRESFKQLLDTLASWMNQQRRVQGDPSLIVRIIEGDADFLRYATSECLAYLQWLVRFADAQDLTSDSAKGE